MAMEETKEVKKTSSTAVDRLSDLPENLIHEIMSFLSPAEAARMSILSKRLSSAHLSFPLLDIQCRYCDHASPFDQHSVLDSVRNSLERRRLSFNNSSSDLINNIKSLSFDVFVSNKVGDFLSALNTVTKLLQYLVNFTLFHKIPHLLINCDGDYRHYHEHHRLDNRLDVGQIESFPTSLFSAKSSTIKTLNLSGVFFGFQDLMLACPLIEDFHLVDCLGLETIRVSGSAKLIKQIFIQGCSGLQRIDVDPDARLESFSYTGPLFKQSQIININLASPKSLKFLELRRAGITDQWVRNNVFECKSLEILVLEDCRMIKKIRLHDNEHLKDLELKNCNAVECVDVVVAGLESFQFGKRVDYDQPPHCRININCCKRLKNLVISDVVVTDKWIVENLSGQTYLENLEFKSCALALTNPIKVYLENLKSMEFSGCPRLPSLEIESPNLISFRYSGKLLSSPPPVLLVSSQNVKVVEIYFDDLDNEAEGFYKTLRDFLSCFAHCKRVILHTLGHFTDVSTCSILCLLYLS